MTRQLVGRPGSAGVSGEAVRTAEPVPAVAPAPPPEAAEAFGDRLHLAVRYAELLAGPGVERGLLGPREVVRLWDRHILNCVALAELIPDSVALIDVGSGAGLPGIVLAIARPDLRATLVEPLLRRATFLNAAVGALGLEVTVRRARAEHLAGACQAERVTARAVAPMQRLLPWTWPLVRPGGSLLAVKGRTAADELEAVRGLLPADAHADVVECGGRSSSPTTVIRVRRSAGRSPAVYP